VRLGHHLRHPCARDGKGQRRATPKAVSQAHDRAAEAQATRPGEATAQAAIEKAAEARQTALAAVTCAFGLPIR